MAVKETCLALYRLIDLADGLIELVEEVKMLKIECLKLKAKTKELVNLLRQVAKAYDELYERPIPRIIDNTEQVLKKAQRLVDKCCRNNLMNRLLFTTTIQATDFLEMWKQLEDCFSNLQWLLKTSLSSDEYFVGIPPIIKEEPALCLIWEYIATLLKGFSMEQRSDAATSLLMLAQDNYRFSKLVIEEGGVPALLKLLEEGDLKGQENAAEAIGLLGKDEESVQQIVDAGACTVFAKILKEGDIKVQSIVAWAISELSYHHLKCDHPFSNDNCICSLLRHFAFKTFQEQSKYIHENKAEH